MRRAKDEGGAHCPGSDSDWKVKPGLTLGHETWTDIFELQLKTENGIWLNDETVALTLAVALRDSLAESIGVQASELGCSTKPARHGNEPVRQSILIFDRNAAGYASSADRHLDSLFRLARQHLECPVDCDSVCPHCVLDFDQRFAADNLDRHVALAFLSDDWLNRLQLPREQAYFGPASRAEYRRLPAAVWRAVSRQGVAGIRLYASGDASTWDVGPSTLRELAYRLAGQGAKVEIVLAGVRVDTLDETDCYLLYRARSRLNLLEGLEVQGQ